MADAELFIVVAADPIRQLSLPLAATCVAACWAFLTTGKGSGTRSSSCFTSAGALLGPPPPPTELVILDRARPPTATASPTTPKAPMSQNRSSQHEVLMCCRDG